MRCRPGENKFSLINTFYRDHRHGGDCNERGRGGGHCQGHLRNGEEANAYVDTHTHNKTMHTGVGKGGLQMKMEMKTRGGEKMNEIKKY